jgi:hypothetical protein
MLFIFLLRPSTDYGIFLALQVLILLVEVFYEKGFSVYSELGVDQFARWSCDCRCGTPTGRK